MNLPLLAAHNPGSVFNGLDWVVIVLFLLGMVVVVWASTRHKAQSGTDYFLSGRQAGWLQRSPLPSRR